ncbi:MAG: hypothetical protein ACREBG_06390 [Pyrinomonadaceae bacterium]
MKIRIVLDEEDGIDSLDPSGEILISDGRSLISEKHTYLDSWLDALIEGLKEIQAGKRASIDLVEEADPLVFEPQNGGVRLTYGNTTVSVDSIEEFHRALRSATEDFLNRVNSAEEASENVLLDSIRRFSEHA